MKIYFINNEPTKYSVEQNGEIWSLHGKVPRRMKPNVSGKCKYPKLNLKHNGKSFTKMVHRMVAETYLEKPDVSSKTREELEEYYLQSFEVDHIDGNVNNSKLNNLRFVTATENKQNYQNIMKGSK